MSETIWWCKEGLGPMRLPLRCTGDIRHANCGPLRLVSPDALVVEREDGEWPESCLSRIKESYEDCDTPSELLDALVAAQENQT